MRPVRWPSRRIQRILACNAGGLRLRWLTAAVTWSSATRPCPSARSRPGRQARGAAARGAWPTLQFAGARCQSQARARGQDLHTSNRSTSVRNVSPRWPPLPQHLYRTRRGDRGRPSAPSTRVVKHRAGGGAGWGGAHCLQPWPSAIPSALPRTDEIFDPLDTWRAARALDKGSGGMAWRAVLLLFAPPQFGQLGI